uniref:Uncharacterized protein n=1 Tax=Onchocerca volvulus TaxID=6282 RepID=A0A8R1TZQ0_ONCVO
MISLGKGIQCLSFMKQTRHHTYKVFQEICGLFLERLQAHEMDDELNELKKNMIEKEIALVQEPAGEELNRKSAKLQNEVKMQGSPAVARKAKVKQFHLFVC